MSVTIPDSVTSIGKWAFFDCGKLVEIINKSSLDIQKGEEMGRFYLGSTVITCWPKNTIEFTDSIKTGNPVKLGERLAIEK